MVDYISNINIGQEVDSGVPDGENWTLLTSDNLGNLNWYGLTYGNGKFVALGGTGYISTSTDGITWTTPASTLSSSGYWNALAYDGTKFVALGRHGHISSSMNGTTWNAATQNANLGNHTWVALCYNGTKFVATSSTGYVSTSSDGLTWATAVQNSDLGNRNWYNLTYDGTKFVALGTTGYVSTSTDGITWTTATLKANLAGHGWQGALAYNGTKFVALGTTGYVSTSTDGIAWTLAIQNINLGNNSWYRMVYADNKFVAISSTGYICTSTDGVLWPNAGGLGEYVWADLTYGDKFVCIDTDSRVATSENGISWTISYSSELDSLASPATWQGIAYGQVGAQSTQPNLANTYIALASNGYTSTSTDGITWTTPASVSALGNRNWSCITNAANGANWVAISKTGYFSYSEDGVSWETATASTALTSENWASITWGGHFVAIADSGSVAFSLLGTYWNKSANSLDTSNGQLWTNICFKNGKYIAISSNGYYAIGTGYYTGTSNFANSSGNDQFEISWSTPVYSTTLHSMGSVFTLAYGDNKFVSVGISNPAKVAISENLKSTSIQIGGENFDGEMGSKSVFSIFFGTVGTGITFPNNPFSLEEYLPNDDYDYEVQFSFGAFTGKTSGNQVSVMVATGSHTSYDEKIFMHVGRVNTRSGSDQSVVGTFILPVYANDRHISVYNASDSGTSSTIGIDAIGYRRIGENGNWSYAVQDSDLGASSYAWLGGAYGNGKYVLLGYHGYTAVSDDETTWTVSSDTMTLPGTTDFWSCLAFGDGKFIALSYDGYTATSTDGATWSTPVSSTSSGSWKDLIYDGSQFMAIGLWGGIATSTDGVNWTYTGASTTGLGSNNWATVAHHNGTYVAVGSVGYVSISTDGSTWSTPAQDATLSSVDSWVDLQYINKQWVLMAANGYVAYMNSGNTWYGAMPNYRWSSYSYWSHIISGSHEFLAVSQNGYLSKLDNKVISNIDIGEEVDAGPDGENWDNIEGLGSRYWYDITYGNGKFVAIGSTGYISTSTDGTTWTTATQNSNLGSNDWFGITYRDGKFVALGYTGYVSTSEDGTTWTIATQDTNLGGNAWRGITYGNGKFVAIGSTGYISTSTDGTTWTTATQNSNLGSHYWLGITYGAGKFVAIGYGGYISTSEDGTTWTTSTQNTNLDSKNWYGLAYGNGKFVAIGNTGYISTSTNGTTWTTAVQNTNLGSNGWCGLTYGADKFIAIGNTGYISTSPDLTTENIPIGGECLDGQWQHCVIRPLWNFSLVKISNSYEVTYPIDLSEYLPDDGYRYELLMGDITLTTAKTSNTAVNLWCKTADYAGFFHLARATTRTSSTEQEIRNCIITVPAHDRRVFIRQLNNFAGTIYIGFTAYRRLSNND